MIETGLLRSVQPASRIRVHGACRSRCCFLAAEGANLFTDLLGFRGRRVGFHFWSLTQVRVIGQKRKLSFRNFLEEKKKTAVYRLLPLHSCLNSLRKNFAEAIACCQN